MKNFWKIVMNMLRANIVIYLKGQKSMHVKQDNLKASSLNK